MFKGATSYDGDISQWDVSRVTDMTDMFLDARSFNDKPRWDASNVMDMYMIGIYIYICKYVHGGVCQTWNMYTRMYQMVDMYMYKCTCMYRMPTRLARVPPTTRQIERVLLPSAVWCANERCVRSGG